MNFDLSMLESLDYKEQTKPSTNPNYQNILRQLADGYTIEQLTNIKKEDIEHFLIDLKSHNLTIDNVKAINQYSNGSNMILGIKRKTISKEDIMLEIYNSLKESLQTRRIPNETIDIIITSISNLDYRKPLYLNYDCMKEIIDKLNISSSNKASILGTIQNINKLIHIDKTINQLDDALSKSMVDESIKVYRALKGVTKKSLVSMDNQVIHNPGYTSTTPIYDDCFAKYDDYDTVIEMSIPKGTQGLDITRFSDYDSVENEILLYDNDLIVYDINMGIKDKNNKEMNFIKGYVVSNDINLNINTINK